MFTPHALEPPPAGASGEFRVNPLYVVPDGGRRPRVAFRLRFPSEDYEQEYGACRQYLPEEVTIARARRSRRSRPGRVPAGSSPTWSAGASSSTFPAVRRPSPDYVI